MIEGAFRENPFVGFGCGGYRSFCGSELARIGPFDRVQVVAGQNNCGKSALIDYFIKVLGAINARGELRKEDNPFVQADAPLGFRDSNEQFQATISLCVSVDALDEKMMLDARSSRQRFHAESLSRLFRGFPYAANEGKAAWIDFTFGREGNAFGYESALCAQYSQYEASGAAIDLTDASLSICSSADDAALNYANVVRAAMPWDLLPKFLKVDAVRSIVDSDSTGKDGVINSGVGLPAALLRLRNPERSDLELSRQRWDKLEGFVRDVLNDQGASLLVSHASHVISVKTTDTDYLPLESLGTGVTELLILASVIACNVDKIICIEEPEIHLHPALQARFMDFLLADESNRFIVTTHSPTIINAAGVQVAHVSKANGVSACRQLDGMVVARDLLDDLGAKASDLLQSNFVVWVEGPSDRIYINHWIEEWAEGRGIRLNEGIHYRVMLYGGKLLNALVANAAGSDDRLIALFRINTHFCVLMDSDKKSKNSSLGETKRRIVDECEASCAMSWVTWGATIENYVPEEALTSAIKVVHPGKKWNHELGNRYVCPLNFKFSGSRSGAPNKIAIAREVCQVGFEPLGRCRERVAKLCSAICSANRIET